MSCSFPYCTLVYVFVHCFLQLLGLGMIYSYPTIVSTLFRVFTCECRDITSATTSFRVLRAMYVP